MKTAVIITHFGKVTTTMACLDSLIKTHNSAFTLYLVSENLPELESCRRHQLKPQMIIAKTNLGFAANNNLAINRALSDECDQFVLLNNDTLVNSNFLTPLIKKLETDGVGLVCPKIYFAPGHEFHQESYTKSELGKVIWYAGGVIDWQNITASHWGVDEVDHGQFNKPVETDFATGCCLAFKKELVEKIGLMREDYFLYWEDVEWSIRAKKAGYQIIYEPKSIVWHKNAGSTGGSGSEIQQYYQTRNRLAFGFENASWRTKLALFKSCYFQYLHANLTVRQGIIAGLWGRMGKK